MSTGKLVSGVLIGAAAGVILGILLAPDKGSETRKKLTKGGTDFTDSIKDKFNSFVDDITNRYEEVKTEAEESLNNGREKLDGVKKDWKESIS